MMSSILLEESSAVPFLQVYFLVLLGLGGPLYEASVFDVLLVMSIYVICLGACSSVGVRVALKLPDPQSEAAFLDVVCLGSVHFEELVYAFPSGQGVRREVYSNYGKRVAAWEVDGSPCDIPCSRRLGISTLSINPTSCIKLF
jgi:hypothetical protein